MYECRPTPFKAIGLWYLSERSSNNVGLNLFCPRPASEETGDVNTRGSGLQCAHTRGSGLQWTHAVLARGELSRFGGQGRRSAQRVCRKPFFPLLGRSSEAFIGICGAPQHLLGYAFIHLLGASEHLFCATMPMRRIIVGHD
jgi:hypothetical protein